jgi:M6 family metalloprotease-like protein
MMKYKIILAGLLTVFLALSAVPPIPERSEKGTPYTTHSSEIFGPSISQQRNFNLPDSILVLRVQFSDVTFDATGSQPSGVPHDKEYFERWMFHLSSYYHDASHGKYHLTETNYTVWDQVFTLPNPMGYYGDNDNRTARIAEFVKDTFDMADAEIDFSLYDSFIIFHAGAGQEADLSGENQDALWSTFVTRKTLQAGLDPDNDDYQGIQTNEKLIREVVIVPESQWHPDSILNETPVYSLFGVLAHLFGHQIGLPTLYDNNSATGRSFGIGNFGIMGTGLWNAKGFVPPLPCAWSRYFLGWEYDTIVELSASAINQQIAHPMSNSSLPKLYKVKITDKEYFLLENRQYNPDNSTLNGFPNFTFPLLPPGEQDYYPPPNENVPRFNFMKNTYLGCEWDFFLPGPGYSDPPAADNVTIDGSGLLIWHIDEHIIEQRFTPDFQFNSVNGNAAHKGVDLEEADGIQHLDAVIDQNSLGSPYDSFRNGNNDYFGDLYYPDTDNIWLPTAESYYGGIPLEIRDISASANVMSFSVFYKWQLQAPDYNGENPFPAMIMDIDLDGIYEIIYPMPSGRIYLWKDDLMDATFQHLPPMSFIYSYDTSNGCFYFPCHEGLDKTAILRAVFFDFNTQFINTVFSDRTWAAPIVIDPNHESQAFLPLNKISENGAELKIYNHFSEVHSIAFSDYIASNMMWDNSILYVLTKGDQYQIHRISTVNHEMIGSQILDEITIEQKIDQAILADWNQDGSPNFLFTVDDSLVYNYHSDGSIHEGYPVNTGLYKSAVPSLADINGNGFLDLLIGGENTFVAINHLGTVSKPSNTVPATDSLNIASGVIAVDLNSDGIPEILGNMSKNRFCIWENRENNEFQLKSDTTISYRKRSRNYPLLFSLENNLTAFICADDGMIFRQELGSGILPGGWLTEYATHGRVASYQFPLPQNQHLTEKVFIEEHTYVYPNPYSSIYTGSIYQGDFRSEAITVKWMISQNAMMNVKVFDIAGNKVFEESKDSFAYVQNDVGIDVKKMSSGMYFALLKANGVTKMLKFAIEK